MTRLFVYLLRLVVILLGYIAASLAASAFIHLIFLASAGFSSEEVPRMVAGSFFSVPFVALFVAYFAFMPATAVVLLGEFLKRRGWLYYALGGAFSALVFTALLPETAQADFQARNMSAILTIVGGGIVGGIAYWAVAGRWAGGWLDLKRRPAPISREPSGS